MNAIRSQTNFKLNWKVSTEEGFHLMGLIEDDEMFR